MDNESTLTIDRYGNKKWINAKGLFHRLDGPAVERFNGTKEWWENGDLHRLDGPAKEWANGTKEWRIEGWLYKKKEDYFNALPDEAKAKCLFSEDFLNG